jgi:carboxylate-amine ligase
VEQELFLIDPESRTPAAMASEVLQLASADGKFDVQAELTPYQIEVATPVCETTDELAAQVLAGRRHLADAAKAAGCGLLAAAVAPIGELGPPVSTDDKRYRLMAYSHQRLVHGQGVCGLHVHVGVENRETAIRISNGIRPWLPVLLSLSVNSPFHRGEDTGYASWRSMLWSRWPVSGPPPHFDSIAQYDRLVSALIESGVVLDDAMVYWDVRPSAKQPTVEIRVADIPTRADEVVVLAELIRALARTVAEEPASGGAVDATLLRAAMWRAARDGIDGLGVNPHTGTLTPALTRARELIDRTTDALRAHGALSIVERHLERVRADGSGAARQRRLFDASDPTALVDALVAETVEC